MPVQTRSQSTTDQPHASQQAIHEIRETFPFEKDAFVRETMLEQVIVQDRDEVNEVEIIYLAPLGRKDAKVKKNERVIAIDFDDVIAQTNTTLVEWHNRQYGTDLHISEWTSYYPYRNRGWGTNDDTTKKLELFFLGQKGTALTPPVATVTAVLKQLAAMGHPLHIVTSRPPTQRECIESWLERHDLQDVFVDKHFLGIYEKASEGVDEDVRAAAEGTGTVGRADEITRDKLQAAWAKNVVAGGKAEVLRSIGAQLLIDDHIGHAEEAAATGMRGLLFGPYGWNRFRWGMDTPEDRYTYEERLKYGYEKRRSPDEEVLHEGVERAVDWSAVLEWVELWDGQDSA